MARQGLAIWPHSAISQITVLTAKRQFCSSASCGVGDGGTFHRSDFSNQGFTAYYDPSAPTLGPLADASIHGATPRITPKTLKNHLDAFVVGQGRAKKILSVAVYNHYQRIQELQRLEDEEEAVIAQQQRREVAQQMRRDFDSPRHPVEDEFPGQQRTVHVEHPSEPPNRPPGLLPSHIGQFSGKHTSQPLRDHSSPLALEKSNVLLLGPSGVGKTLMAKTLARALSVPFSMSDCTPFTQAGYIGEDAEVCIQRLLAAANYDVKEAERGIICLDEIDKIATAKVSHGKDVSGEGVQQSLLKILEGTTVQVQAKQERSSSRPDRGSTGSHYRGSGYTGSSASNSPGSGAGGSTTTGSNKGEVFNVQTDNILFICTGAFNGLHRFILDRISKGSMGFGARVRSSPASASSSGLSSADLNDPTLQGDKETEELFRKYLPFYTTSTDVEDSDTSASHNLPEKKETKRTYNALDLATPADLQKFGLIPELTGRLPITCALSPLSLQALRRVLTEPRNSLVAQYTQLFALSGIELRLTTPALHEVAKAAAGMGTGARGLRTVMERLLGDAMFESPGSGIRFILVTGKAARREEAWRGFGKGEGAKFWDEVRLDEEEWEKGLQRPEPNNSMNRTGFGNFAEYREKFRVAGNG